ncbi:MAG: hypothetical protein Alis3KO_25710 [Aliiglaciecola sp.]
MRGKFKTVLVQGQIEEVTAHAIKGWLYADCDSFRPLVLVNKQPYFGNEFKFNRLDVNEFLKKDGKFGFEVPIAASFGKDLKIELFAVTPIGVFDVADLSTENKYPIEKKLQALVELHEQAGPNQLSAILLDAKSLNESDVEQLSSNLKNNSNTTVAFIVGDLEASLLNQITQTTNIPLIETSESEWLCISNELCSRGIFFASVLGIGKEADKYVDVLRIANSAETKVETLVLVWKMPDAGLYGRRIDQIARSFHSMHPDKRIIVVEVLTDELKSIYENKLANQFSDASLILSLFEDKKSEGHIEGIEYFPIETSSEKILQEQLVDFCILNQLSTDNTQIVFFPIIPFWHVFVSIFRSFKLHIDVVDNELSWCNNDQLKIEYIAQYKAMISRSQTTFFNSEENMNLFHRIGLTSSNSPTHLIENWYSLPKSETRSRAARKQNETKVIYTGNLNDRIDWDLLFFIIKECKENIRFTIIGNADHTSHEVERLKACVNVEYLGPLPELSCIKQIRQHDIAIIPHKIDSVSKFMNPLKVMMYEALSIPTITLSVPGVDERRKNVIHVKDQDDFVNAIKSYRQSRFSRLFNWLSNSKGAKGDSGEKRYFSILGY